MDKWLYNNTFVKMVSLVLAIMLWMVVNHAREPSSLSSGSKQQQLSTRVEKMDLGLYYDEQMYIVKAPPTVQVEVKGSPDLFALSSIILSNKNEVYVDLSDYKSGMHSVPVQTKGFVSGFQVKVTPERVTVNIERLRQVQKKVKVEVIGHPLNGYISEKPILELGQVTVTVPESQMNNIGAVQGVITVENMVESVDQKVALQVYDRNGQTMNVKVSPPSIDVKVPLVAPSKVVPIKIVTKGYVPTGEAVQSVLCAPKEVTIYGPQDVLDTIKTYTGPEIDWTTWTHDGTRTYPVPLRDKIVKVEPDVIDVVAVFTKDKKMASKSLSILLTGAAPDREVEFKQAAMEQLTLNLEGSAENIDQLKSDEIKASVDVSQLPIGEHIAPIVVNTPSEIKVMNPVEQLKVAVIVKERVTSHIKP